MKHLRRNLFIIFLTICSIAFAQPYCAVRTFNVRDGLAANIISGIGQDGNGLMWFSTWNGLCCFDGYGFTTFRNNSPTESILTTNRILKIKPIGTYGIWCATYDKRLYFFDFKECQFLDASSKIKELFGDDFYVRNFYPLQNGHTWMTNNDEGGAIYCTENALAAEGKGIRQVKLATGTITNKVVEDSIGNEWIFTNKGVFNSDSRLFTKTVMEHLLPMKSRNVFVSRDGTIAIWSKGDKTIRNITRATAADGSPLTVNCVLSLTDDVFLLGTSSGVVTVDVAHRFAMSHISIKHIMQPSPAVVKLAIDSHNRIFAFGEAKAITYIDLKNNSTTFIPTENTPTANQTTISDKPFFMEDANGTVWVVPTGGTLCYFDEQNASLRPYVLKAKNDLTRTFPTIRKIFVDAANNLWFAGAHDLTLVNFMTQQFKTLPTEADHEVRSVMIDHQKRIWAGNSRGLITLFDLSGRLLGYVSPSGNIVQTPVLFSDHIYSIFEDQQQRVWIGTRGKGLFIIAPDGKVRHFAHNPADKNSLSDDNVYCFDQDSKGRIYIATFGGGINITESELIDANRFVNKNNVLTSYPKDSFMNVRRITHDDKGVVICSTTDGLLTFDTSPKGSDDNARHIRFYKTKHIQGDSTSLFANDVMQVLQTAEGNIMVSTMAGGLQQINTRQLLADNLPMKHINLHQAQRGMIQSFINDRQGNIWIIRENSINRYSPRDSSFAEYAPNDLGHDTEFTEALPAYSAQEGVMAVAAMGGLTIFKPEALNKSSYKPQIVFISVLYQGEDAPQPLLYRDRLDIPSDKRNVTINFAALDYNDNYIMQYAYKLEGVDKEWNYTGRNHSAPYNHLPAGHHTLYVKSTNSDGIWTDNLTTLDIYVHPTFWETIWAKMLYFLLAAAIIAAIIYMLSLREKSKMQRQLNDMQTEFFTQIGHKLRTPLTLIGGPATEVLNTEPLSDRGRTMMEMVKRNARNMLDLVNAMLEHNKNQYVDLGIMEIEERGEVLEERGERREERDYLNGASPKPQTSNLKPQTKMEEREYPNGASPKPQTSNLKPQTSSLKPQTSTNVAQVPPSLGEGMGVGSNLKPQTSNLKLLVVEDNPDLRAFLTAILSTTYEVITAENGKEGLEKALQEMPDFIITDVMMPVMDGMTMVHNIKENKDICHIPIIILSAKASLEDKLQGLAEGIDDYITKPFSATYLKHRVENIIAQRHMLQEMYLQQISEWNSSGSESGESLKEESGERREERPNPNPSPREGRDLPLTPPEGSGSANSEQKLPTHSNTVPPSLGEGMGVGFLSSLMSFLDSHLDDTDLKIDDMAAAVSLGRTVFYGKLKSIVGMTPIDFLRHVRLQKAQQLLANSSLNVSEIAYTVGFSDPKYFSKIFRKELGVSPTEYRAQMQKQ